MVVSKWSQLKSKEESNILYYFLLWTLHKTLKCVVNSRNYMPCIRKYLLLFVFLPLDMDLIPVAHTWMMSLVVPVAILL